MSGDQVDDLERGHRQLRAGPEDGTGAGLIEEIVILKDFENFEICHGLNRFWKHTNIQKVSS